MAEIGAGGGSSYPGALDANDNPEVNSPNVGKTKARKEVVEDLSACIIKIETELGTDPAGSLTDVKTWLQTEHSGDGTHSDITPDSAVMGGKLTLKKGADVASGTALPILEDGNYFDVTGTTTVTSIDTVGVGHFILLHFDDAVLLTHDAADLVMPGGANYTTIAGDELGFFEYATGDWRCIYSPIIVDDAVTTDKILDGAVTGVKLNTTVVDSAAAQAIAATASWTPAVAGYYNFVIDDDGVNFQLNVSGWKGVTDNTHWSAGTLICDGTNMRLYNGDAAQRNITWQSF